MKESINTAFFVKENEMVAEEFDEALELQKAGIIHPKRI